MGPFPKCRLGQNMGMKTHYYTIHKLLFIYIICQNACRCKHFINIFPYGLSLLMEVKCDKVSYHPFANEMGKKLR